MNELLKNLLYILFAPILFLVAFAICISLPVLLLILALYLIILAIIGGLLTLIYLLPYLILNLSSKKLALVTFIYSLLSFIAFYFIDNLAIPKDLAYKIAGISFISNFAYILSSYLALLSFNLLDFLNLNFNKYKIAVFSVVTSLNILIELISIKIYCNQIEAENTLSASMGLMIGTLPLMLAIVTYLYFIVGYISIFKTKQNTNTKEELITTTSATISSETNTNKIINIEFCTKDEIKNIAGFSVEKADLFIYEREKGNMWYDIDSFVQFFEIQPHEMVEIMDILVFPLKTISKSKARKIDI